MLYRHCRKALNRNKEAVAETIENNIRGLSSMKCPLIRSIMRTCLQLLDELIKERKEEARSYEEYLAKIVEFTKKIKNPAKTTYPKTLNSNAKRALYDNLNQNEELAIALDAEICHTKKDGWRGNKIKEREVKNAIRKHITDDAEVERVFELVKNQSEY